MLVCYLCLLLLFPRTHRHHIHMLNILLIYFANLFWRNDWSQWFIFFLQSSQVIYCAKVIRFWLIAEFDIRDRVCSLRPMCCWIEVTGSQQPGRGPVGLWTLAVMITDLKSLNRQLSANFDVITLNLVQSFLHFQCHRKSQYEQHQVSTFLKLRNRLWWMIFSWQVIVRCCSNLGWVGVCSFWLFGLIKEVAVCSCPFNNLYYAKAKE